MSYYVQKQGRTGNWVSEDFSFETIPEAKEAAKNVGVGPDPCALRIVDDQSVVHAWVPRNGWKPGGALPPKDRR